MSNIRNLEKIPGEKLVRRRASDKKIRQAFIEALGKVKKLWICPEALINLTKKQVETGIIPVTKLKTSLVGETSRLALINEAKLSQLYLPLAEKIREERGLKVDPRVLARALVAKYRENFPIIVEGGALTKFWYKIEICDLFNGGMLEALAVKEAISLMMLRIYEFSLKQFYPFSII